jgi:multicomponent Na+:H+ antiporter subunit D
VVKAGVFSITKIIIYIFGVDWLFSLSTTQWLVWITSFTIIVASLIALRQTNLKRLLAYSTIGQLSYVVMASAILKPMAEIGAALHMVAHAFGKITLFFAAGAIYVASKKIDITQLAGIGRRMPVTMAAFTVGALSMIGVPPTGGFVSKWYILGGAFEADNFLAIFTIIASTALNAAYFLPIIYAAWFLPEDQAPKKPHGEAPWPMVVALALTALLTLGFFFFNGPVIEIERQLVGGLQ